MVSQVRNITKNDEWPLYQLQKNNNIKTAIKNKYIYETIVAVVFLIVFIFSEKTE